MKAALCKSLDGPDAIVVEDVPDPVAGPGEAVVRVRAAALNFFDTLMTRGKYQHKPAVPFSPSGEIAGVVEALPCGHVADRVRAQEQEELTTRCGERLQRVRGDRWTFALDLEAAQETTLLKVAGVKAISVGGRTEVRLGAPAYLEVAMALDNTGSMKDFNKIGSLKDSASALVERLFADGAEVKIGLVPFAQYVNVGTANAGAAWLSAPPSGWTGCVGSRPYPLNTEDQGYAGAPVPAVAAACPRPILPLTADKAAVLSAIDGMTASGWTYIAEGVAWGRRVLSPGAPFSGGLSAAEIEKRQGVKALIVLTDGENTRAPTYPLHDSADRALADQLTERLCDETKRDGVVVYTIAFGVSDPGVRGLLQRCGSEAGNYFEPSNAAELSAAFARIAARLRSLSLSG